MSDLCVEWFNPSENLIQFNFEKDECQYLRKGICELDEIDEALPEENYKGKCQKIYFGLLSGDINEIKRIPCIHLCSCGHFDVTDGRHRLCVAPKLGKKLKVERIDNDEVCFTCIGKSNQKSNKEDGVEIMVDGLYFIYK